MASDSWEPCVVDTAPLADRVNQHVESLIPPETRVSLPSGRLKDTAGAVAAIERRIGEMVQDGRLRRPVSRDAIENVRACRNPSTELWVADAILAAIGQADAISHGMIEVRPRPVAKALPRRDETGRWAGCCGGSQLRELAASAVARGVDVEELVFARYSTGGATPAGPGRGSLLGA